MRKISLSLMFLVFITFLSCAHNKPLDREIDRELSIFIEDNPEVVIKALNKKKFDLLEVIKTAEIDKTIIEKAELSQMVNIKRNLYNKSQYIALATEAISRQSKKLSGQFYSIVTDNQVIINTGFPDSLFDIAYTLGINLPKMKKDMGFIAVEEKVNRSINEAVQTGVFVGKPKLLLNGKWVQVGVDKKAVPKKKPAKQHPQLRKKSNLPENQLTKNYRKWLEKEGLGEYQKWLQLKDQKKTTKKNPVKPLIQSNSDKKDHQNLEDKQVYLNFIQKKLNEKKELDNEKVSAETKEVNQHHSDKQ